MGNAGAPAAERDVPGDTTRAGPGQAVATVDIVVPAFNEGGCIEGLLKDLFMAKQDGWFRIQQIYVISDGSTDQTDDIVRQVATWDQRVRLVSSPATVLALQKGYTPFLFSAI